MSDHTAAAIAALDATILAAQAAKAALLSGSSTPQRRLYERDNLPPGVDSWRPVQDLHRAGKLHMLRVGRKLYLEPEEWDRHLATCQTTPRKREPAADPMARFPKRCA